MIEGSCHCGAVRLTLPAAPPTMTLCNCSICRRYGVLWGYYPRAQLAVTGHPDATEDYVWGDRLIRFVRCAHCGCVTHYESLEPQPDDRCAVNMRNFDPALMAACGCAVSTRRQLARGGRTAAVRGGRMTETFSALMSGFAVALQPINLLWGVIGVTLGTLIGVLPGVGPALTVAMLLPLTTKLDPTGALIMFAGIYYGAMYGGSTTTILLNAPGESASIATALEGNQMAKRGRAGPALATAAIGSFVAGTIATLLLTLLAPVVVEIALQFGPTEYFALMVFAFVTVASVLGSSTVRGLASLFVGLLLGVIGIDEQTGQMRFTLGVPELLDGIDVVVLAVGLFAVGEALYVVAHASRLEERMEKLKGSLWMTRDDWRRSWPAWLRATGIGFPFGTIPAGGTEIPTFLSYATERKFSKHPEEFGKGAIEGVAGPEAANNAASTGVLVPLLTLGIPTSATAAILLAAFQNYGIQPGPLLFSTQGALVWGLIASLYIGNILLLVLNLLLLLVGASSTRAQPC